MAKKYIGITLGDAYSKATIKFTPDARRKDVIMRAYEKSEYGRTWCTWRFFDGSTKWLRTEEIREIQTERTTNG